MKISVFDKAHVCIEFSANLVSNGCYKKAIYVLCFGFGPDSYRDWVLGFGFEVWG